MNIVLTSRGRSKETSSEKQACHSDHSNDRKLNIGCEDAPTSTSSDLTELRKQNSKMDIEPLQRPSSVYTGNSLTPLTTAAVTLTAELNSIKERSTEVTPERTALNCGSTTKRKLKLEENTLCRPQSKRRRTVSTRDSGGTGGSGKKTVAKLGNSLQSEGVKNSGQMTIQSFFRPA